MTETIKYAGGNTPIMKSNLISGLNYDYFERFFITTDDFDKISPIESGEIGSFHLESNDGSRLFIDDEEIIENDANHGAIEEQGSIGLKAGFMK